jgi:translation initiation factor IF-3
LVEIAPKAQPPVVKIINYAKFKYQEEKKQRKERKKQKNSEGVKEIRLSPFIGEADLKNKIAKAEEFAKKESRLRIVIRFFGRQITKKEFGYQTLEKIKQELANIYEPEEAPKLIGNRIILLMKPIIKNDKEKV